MARQNTPTLAAFLCAAYKDDIDELYADAKELNEAAGERWDKMVQSALNNPIAKDIHVDWVWTGPGPDPRGEEGEPGQEGSIFQDLMDIFDGYMALKRAKEAKQCGDASGRGND